MLFRKFLFSFAFFTSFQALAQLSTTSDISRVDTLFFLNGEIRPVKVVDTLRHLIRFLPSKRKAFPRVLEIEKSKIFSISFSDGHEKIIYFHDSLSGNVFSVIEAKMFMLGEQEADKNYRNKWPFLIGFCTGIISPLVFSNAILLSPIPAVIVPLHTLVPVIKIDTEKIIAKDYLQYDTYLMGYEKVARKKNFIQSILGAGIGLACGMGVWAILK
jgi:hypothetical protein